MRAYLCHAFSCGKRWVGASTALIVALALPACGNPAGPPGPPLEITLSILTLVVSRNAANAPNTISCGYYINARAAGGRLGDRSSWVSGESVWAFAGGGSQTTNWSQADLVNFFSFNLSRGEIASGRIQDQWMAPYTVTHNFRYRVVGGDEKTATVTLTCQ